MALCAITKYKHPIVIPFYILGLELEHEQTYFATVIAVNKVGMIVVATSDAIVVDSTPPKVHILLL